MIPVLCILKLVTIGQYRCLAKYHCILLDEKLRIGRREIHTGKKIIHFRICLKSNDNTAI